MPLGRANAFMPYSQKPARINLTAKQGEIIEHDFPCGRDLTYIDASMMYLYLPTAGRGSPTAVVGHIANPEAGIVRVVYDTTQTPIGEWRWTLFVIAEAQPIAIYSGIIRIEEP